MKTLKNLVLRKSLKIFSQISYEYFLRIRLESPLKIFLRILRLRVVFRDSCLRSPLKIFLRNLGLSDKILDIIKNLRLGKSFKNMFRKSAPWGVLRDLGLETSFAPRQV